MEVRLVKSEKVNLSLLINLRRKFKGEYKMKRKSTIVFVLIVLILGTMQPSFAIKKLAQAGMPFLTLDVSGRAAGMGASYVAVGNDATAMFYNLAGLAFVEGFDVMINQTNWLLDTKHYAAGVAYGLGNLGTFGLSVVYMNYGSFTETWPYEGSDPALINQGYETGLDFDIGEYAIGLSYARRLSSKFSVGSQIKYVKQDLYESLIFHEVEGKEMTVQNEEGIIAFDFGTLYYTGFKDLRFGMSVRNFSQQGRYVKERFELPLSFKLGVAMDVLTLFNTEDTSHKLTLAVDAWHPRDYTERIHIGAEYLLMDVLALRAGYKFNYDEEGLTAGVGVLKSFSNFGIRIDYSYSDFGQFFDAVHRISWSITYK